MDVMYIASHLILYLLLIAAVIQDFDCMKVSNRLILTGLGGSLSFRLLGGESEQIIWFLPDIIIPVIVLYLLYLAGILGAADIKLFSVVSGFTNLKYCIYSIVFAFIFTAIWSFARLIRQGKLGLGIVNGLVYFRKLFCGNFLEYDSECEKICFSLAVYIGVLSVDVLSIL